MRVFLDTSVLLAACGSARGASREIFRLAGPQHWSLVTIPYVLEEVSRNLVSFDAIATVEWLGLRSNLRIRENVLSLHLPTLFAAGKDRPILFSALAWADVLLNPG